MSIAFAEQLGKPMREVHELHYRYSLRGDRIDLQRQPNPYWNDKFPVAPWHNGRNPSVLGIESTMAAPVD